MGAREGKKGAREGKTGAAPFYIDIGLAGTLDIFDKTLTVHHGWVKLNRETSIVANIFIFR